MVPTITESSHEVFYSQKLALHNVRFWANSCSDSRYNFSLGVIIIYSGVVEGQC